MLYIAYTREDALFAIQLTEDLAALGVDVWMDLNEIAPEADWASVQRAAIEACEGLLVVLSPEAMHRDHMRREISQAFDGGKPVYLAVARRSPWRDWLRGLPVADFTSGYESGLDALLLNVMGDEKQFVDNEADAADLWLRKTSAAEGIQRHSAPEDASEERKKPRKSMIKRFLNRQR